MVSEMISKELLSYITDFNEIENSVISLNPIIYNTFKEVYNACRENAIDQIHKFKIYTIVDYLNEQLYIGHWSSIPLMLKKAFYVTSFFKAVVLLHTDASTQTLREALKYIDLGILLGASLDKNNELLTESAKYITKELVKASNIIDCDSETNKRKREIFPEFDCINATLVDSNILPSIESFVKNYFNPQMPVKIEDSINHWPAIYKWVNINYLLQIAGERTVPIEIGTQYSDENWSQKLMTLREFIEKYYLNDGSEMGYLAQHNLLDQIPELKEDIFVPEYCYTTRDLCNNQSPTLEINAWFGRKGTVSSLHFDPKDNLLTQVYGTKLVIMFAPNDSKYLYAHENKMLDNTSKVNPIKPDLKLFPRFPNAKMFKCLLEPGSILYIPPKWWHYVVALENSFSVNFWWT